MKGQERNKNSALRLITLIIAGETVFFLPFVLARIFRPTLLTVFGINNTELGTYFSVYGVVAMISYLFGGTLADRYPARNLMSIALWLTSLGGFIMAWIPPSGIMKVIYGLYGFTSIFLFWAAMIRATREWGGKNSQGRAFGLLEGGRGATAALLGTLAFLLFSQTSDEHVQNVSVSSDFHPFQIVIMAVSIFTLLCGFLVWFVIPVSTALVERQKLFKKEKVFKLIKLPKMWMLAIMIVCGYVGYKITDDYSLFAKEVMGYNDIQSAGVGTAALWMRAFVAILAGLIADRLNKINLIAFCYGIAAIGGLLIGFGVLKQVVFIMMINLLMTMVGVYGVRALYFAVLKEAKIPLSLTGTAVGIVSFIGYTPDVFMSPWMGYMLDRNPGVVGHQHVFIVLASFMAIGLLTSMAFGLNKNSKPV